MKPPEKIFMTAEMAQKLKEHHCSGDYEYALKGEELRGLKRYISRWLRITDDKGDKITLNIIKREIERRMG